MLLTLWSGRLIDLDALLQGGCGCALIACESILYKYGQGARKACVSDVNLS